jgi:hypothetical protein
MTSRFSAQVFVMLSAGHPRGQPALSSGAFGCREAGAAHRKKICSSNGLEESTSPRTPALTHPHRPARPGRGGGLAREGPDKPGSGSPYDAMTEVSRSEATASLATETTAPLFASLTSSGRLGSMLG